MPLYPYRCTKCGYKFEKIQSFSAEPETECPKCQGLLERPLTAPGLQFKGAGWYVNDYSPKGGSSGDSKPDAAKPAEKTEIKAPCGANCACPAAAPSAPNSSAD